MNIHPPLETGERFCGNVEDGKPLSPSLQGLEVVLRKPAFDINGHMLTGHSAVILTASGLATYNRRQEARLEAIRSGKASR
jgi:hypothetical protein